MTFTDVAYAAGVVDSDGTICISRSKDGYYRAQVKVAQVEPEAVDLLHRMFGGTRGLYKQPASLPSVIRRTRDLHTWNVSGKRAALIAAVLLPWLRIKKSKAENVIRLHLARGDSTKQAALWVANREAA